MVVRNTSSQTMEISPVCVCGWYTCICLVHTYIKIATDIKKEQ